ncbi:MAG: hypothetical protein WC476_03830 [Phycisphaerae bacterium]
MLEKEFKNQSAKRKTIELLRRNLFLPQIKKFEISRFLWAGSGGFD